jgi:hypothetical protein
VTITGPTSDPTFATSTASLALSGTATDDTSVTTVSWVNDRGGSGTATGTTNWSATIALQSGVNILTVTAQDGAGNPSTDVLTVTYTPPDTTAPTVTITGPTTDPTFTTSTASLALTGTATDDTSVTTVSWVNDRGGSGTATGTTNWSATVTLQTGINVLTVTAQDGAGNPSTDVLTVTYTPPDTTAPTVTITGPTSDPTFATSTASLALTGTASDDTSVTTVTWVNNRGGGGTAIGTTSWSVAAVALQSGANVLTVTARDGAGNESTDVLTVTYTAIPLTASVLSPNGGEKMFVNVPTVIRWSASGAAAIDVAVSRNGGAYTNLAGCTGLSGTATSCSWTPTGPATTTALIRVTARDSGSATAVDISDAVFEISSSTPTVTVTSPNTAVAWGTGSRRILTWNHNLGAMSFVRVELTRNGTTFETLATSVANTTATTGELPWTVTGPLTTNARIRVSWVDGAATDISNAAFSIQAPSVTVTAPNTNVNWLFNSNQNITWTHNLGTLESVSIELSRDSGATWTTLTANVQNSANATGTYTWTGVTGPATSAARVRVIWTSNGAVQDASNVNFRISSRITVTAPNTNVSWGAGSTRTVTWTHNYGTSQTFDLSFSPDAGATWVPLAAAVPALTATTGAYTGAMPAMVTTQALIRVSPTGAVADGDVSDVVFTLAAPFVTVSVPNTNVNWATGQVRNVTWSHNLGTAESVIIEVSRDAGLTWTSITPAPQVPNSANTTGTFSWTVTGPATTQARIRVTWAANGAVTDMSNVNFRIR